MGYIEQNLIKDEKLIQKANLHWFIYAKSILIFLFGMMFFGSPENTGLFAFFTMLSIVFFIDALIKRRTTELAVTNKRVIAKYGLISRQTIELNLKKIEGLNVDQGILGRIFNFGNVVISGTGGKQSPIKYISEPLVFRKTVNEEIEA